MSSSLIFHTNVKLPQRNRASTHFV